MSQSEAQDQGVLFQDEPYQGIHPAKTYTIFTQPPADFSPRFQAVGCFCEYDGKVLVLHRNADTSEGNTWGIPGGKIEEGETPRFAAARETFEETEVPIDQDALVDLGVHYIRLSRFDFIFYMFRVALSDSPQVKISPEEHQEAAWVTSHEALDLPLMTGEIESFIHYNRVMGVMDHRQESIRAAG